MPGLDQLTNLLTFFIGIHGVKLQTQSAEMTTKLTHLLLILCLKLDRLTPVRLFRE